jgi:hypothetical protein
MKSSKAIFIILCTPIYLLLNGLANLLLLILQIPLAFYWIVVFIKHKKTNKELYENRTSSKDR